MGRKWLSLCLTVLIVCMLSSSVFARGFDADQTGSISITLVEKHKKTPIVGAEFSVYCVADAYADRDGEPVYELTDAFASSGLSADDPDILLLEEIAAESSASAQTLTTNHRGKAKLSDLTPGLYFVRQTGLAEGFAPCNPFLVSVPDKVSGRYVYHVDASPKTEVAKSVDITVKKVWNTDEFTAVPSSVTVRLLRNGTAVEDAVLSEENNWQTTFRRMPQSDGYSVEEVDIPENYTATYSCSGYDFTVTNSTFLPQTGQTVWPIPVLAAAGLLLVAFGVILLRSTRKRHA